MKKQIFSLMAGVGLLGIISCSNECKEEHTTAKYRASIEKVFSAFGSGYLAGMDTMVSDNYVDHTPPPGMEVKGVQGFLDMIKMNHEAFPDCKITILDYCESGDLVMVHYNWKGTNTGGMGPGMPATNKSVDANGVDIMKFANGRCTDHWGYFEEMKFMTQLGMMPAMPDFSSMVDSTKKK